MFNSGRRSRSVPNKPEGVQGTVLPLLLRPPQASVLPETSEGPAIMGSEITDNKAGWPSLLFDEET
jgi:hypothetical protein